MLVGAQGNVPVIQQSSKAIAEAMPLLIAGAKRAAQKNEDEGVKQVRKNPTRPKNLNLIN
jgi:hypothetical protein